MLVCSYQSKQLFCTFQLMELEEKKTESGFDSAEKDEEKGGPSSS